jgi:hypothetical protein
VAAAPAALAAAACRTAHAGAVATRCAWPARATVVVVYLGLSIADALLTFAPMPSTTEAVLARAASVAEPWRLVNTYHLFAQITRERIEPRFEVETGGGWQGLEMWHKAGDPHRAPDLVAPHQPRVDFQLWFYGLSFQNGTPAVRQRACSPASVATPRRCSHCSRPRSRPPDGGADPVRAVSLQRGRGPARGGPRRRSPNLAHVPCQHLVSAAGADVRQASETSAGCSGRRANTGNEFPDHAARAGDPDRH